MSGKFLIALAGSGCLIASVIVDWRAAVLMFIANIAAEVIWKLP